MAELCTWCNHRPATTTTYRGASVCRDCKSSAESHEEHDRLEGAIPYGLCFQFSLETLRSFQTSDEARAWYQGYREAEATLPSSIVPSVADVLQEMHASGCSQDEAVHKLGGQP